jgi:hypothetical protein
MLNSPHRAFSCPPLPGWQERSQFTARHGLIDFYHCDFYGQALAKIERDHARDRHDVEHMIRSGEMDFQRLWNLFQKIEHFLNRYPTLDPTSLKPRVREIASKPS